MSTPSFELPGRELAFREETCGFTLTLKRNCSISPAGLACVFAALAIAALAIAAGFALAGAWLILPFAGLEVLLLGAAFLLQARHATDYERLVLDGGRLTVEVAEAERVARYELDARALRVENEGQHVVVRGPRAALLLGRHLDNESRAAFAAELQKRLRI
ncbi:MAG TPA: DUF2244 domain-containing protein [Burkholderiales bacterium]|nr:DUF2244 domain-containing protein [Burkholderiales bacterium]